eukprot:scaffold93721_cov63-Phaeocystis_antarctica.AAC.2
MDRRGRRVGGDGDAAAPRRAAQAACGQSGPKCHALWPCSQHPSLPTLSRYAPAHAPFPQRSRGPHLTAFDQRNSYDHLGRAPYGSSSRLTLTLTRTPTLTLTRPGTVRLWLEAGPVVSTEDMPLQGAACCCVL